MNELFPILAIETSGELCSVALIIDEKKFIELNYLDKQIHSQKLIGMIDSVLNSADYDLASVKSIAVSMGPGSFTGLRIGLSVVKGIAFGINLPIIPVPTFDAFAFHVGKYILDGTKFVITVSANIEELYFARFIKLQNKIEVVEELKLVEKKNIESILEKGELVYGEISGFKNSNTVIAPSAKSIGEWAYLYGKDLLTFDPDYMEPNYFKKFIVRAIR